MGAGRGKERREASSTEVRAQNDGGGGPGSRGKSALHRVIRVCPGTPPAYAYECLLLVSVADIIPYCRVSWQNSVSSVGVVVSQGLDKGRQRDAARRPLSYVMVPA